MTEYQFQGAGTPVFSPREQGNSPINLTQDHTWLQSGTQKRYVTPFPPPESGIRLLTDPTNSTPTDPPVNQLIQSPFLDLFKNIYRPYLIKYPIWLVRLKLNKHSVRFYISREAEDQLFGLVRDVQPQSFLQFCIYLQHERLLESCHLMQLSLLLPCPVVITGQAVADAIARFSRLLLFRNLKVLLATQSDSSDSLMEDEKRREKRELSPSRVIVKNILLSYDWDKRDQPDVRSYRKFNEQILTHPKIPFYIKYEALPEKEDMSELRQLQFNIRTMHNVTLNHLTLVGTSKSTQTQQLTTIEEGSSRSEPLTASLIVSAPQSVSPVFNISFTETQRQELMKLIGPISDSSSDDAPNLTNTLTPMEIDKNLNQIGIYNSFAQYAAAMRTSTATTIEESKSLLSVTHPAGHQSTQACIQPTVAPVTRSNPTEAIPSYRRDPFPSPSILPTILPNLFYAPSMSTSQPIFTSTSTSLQPSIKHEPN